jgi:general secretion pathway protein G
MKKAFTMIELIFVIVILGILAAVAIPKMMATRTDAEISKIATNLNTAKNEIASYVTATGKLETNGSKMSNVINEMEQAGIADNTIDDKTTIKTKKNDGTLEKCVTLDWSDDVNLSITYESNISGDVCKGVKKLVKPVEIPIRGQGVTY